MDPTTIWLAATLFATVPALAQETRTVRVELSSDANEKRLEGRIEGEESVDYLVPAKAGQRLSVVYRSGNMGTYIDIFPPRSDEAMHKGSNLGNRFEGTLAETGDYRVHVYMMPNAVHRGEIADFTLDLSVDGGERGDFADGLAGGPDFWEVTGVAKAETLKLHSGPSVAEDVVGRVQNGTRLRNLRCKMEDGSRWCRVRTLGEDAIEGWADGLYLMESAVPEPGGGNAVVTGDDPNAPELFVRTSGEIEVNFKSGCGALFDADGSKITSGSSCSAEQLRQATEAVKTYRR